MREKIFTKKVFNEDILNENFHALHIEFNIQTTVFHNIKKEVKPKITS